MRLWRENWVLILITFEKEILIYVWKLKNCVRQDYIRPFSFNYITCSEHIRATVPTTPFAPSPSHCSHLSPESFASLLMSSGHMPFSVLVKSTTHTCEKAQLSSCEKCYSIIGFKNHHQHRLETNRHMAEETCNTVMGEWGSEAVQTFPTAPCRCNEIISGHMGVSRCLVKQL